MSQSNFFEAHDRIPSYFNAAVSDSWQELLTGQFIKKSIQPTLPQKSQQICLLITLSTWMPWGTEYNLPVCLSVSVAQVAHGEVPSLPKQVLVWKHTWRRDLFITPASAILAPLHSIWPQKLIYLHDTEI